MLSVVAGPDHLSGVVGSRHAEAKPAACVAFSLPPEASARLRIGVRRRRRGRGRRRRRRRGCLYVTGPGGKSERRWGRTRRCGLVGLEARLVGPAISDDQSENHDDGDDCRQPRPDRSRAAGPLAIESTERIGAARIGVARVRHHSPPFLGGQAWCWRQGNGQPTTMFLRTGNVSVASAPLQSVSGLTADRTVFCPKD